MTRNIDTSQPSVSAHDCCGGPASKEKAVAKPEAASSSEAKRSAPAEALGYCSRDESPSDADQMKRHEHQS